MKRILYLAVLCTLCFLLPANVQAKKKYPVIKFEQTTVDLGTFAQDDAVCLTIKIRLSLFSKMAKGRVLLFRAIFL